MAYSATSKSLPSVGLRTLVRGLATTTNPIAPNAIETLWKSEGLGLFVSSSPLLLLLCPFIRQGVALFATVNPGLYLFRVCQTDSL